MGFSVKNKLIMSVLVTALISTEVQATSYSVTQLIGATGSYPSSINNAGMVVSTIDDYGKTGWHQAALWQPSEVTAMLIGDDYSVALGVNDNGLVIGYTTASNNGNNAQAIIWQAGSNALISLNGLGGNSYATSINDDNQVVGASIGTNGVQAVLWQSGSNTPISLNGLSGNSYATSINNNGQIVGYSPNIDNTTRNATLWQADSIVPTKLNGLGGNSWANDINSSGFIVGGVQPAGNSGVSASLWKSGETTATILGGLGSILSQAISINDYGTVVGYSYNSDGSKAVIWQPGSTAPIDLNNLITVGGIVLQSAVGINNKGQIIAYDWNGNLDVLTPIPTAPTLWLIGSGLIAMLKVRKSK